jgi:steroid delta-isomerase-like uncharacterized protein
MSTQESKDVVRTMVERAMIDGAIEEAVTAYHANFIYHNPVIASMPTLPPGPEGVQLLMASSRKAFPNMAYRIVALIAEDDMVAVLYTWTGTHLGEISGLPATGRTVTATGAIVCRVEDGKIVEQWDVDDRLDVMQQLGLIPAPEVMAS